jgi:hypothetical protein
VCLKRNNSLVFSASKVSLLRIDRRKLIFDRQGLRCLAEAAYCRRVAPNIVGVPSSKTSR